MNNCFSIQRDVLERFRSSLPKRALTNAYLMLLHLLIEANHIDSMVYGIPVKRGQILRGREALSKETGLTESQVRTTIKNLVILKEISYERANELANETNLITCLNYNSWCDQEKPNSQRVSHKIANESPTVSHIQEEEVSKEGKEVDQNLLSETSSDLFGKVEKSEEKPEPKPRAKKVSTVDPQVNPVPILEEIQKSGVVVDFGKDGTLLKSIMVSRHKAGVRDVPAEVREMWARFKVVSLNGRGHNVGTFKFQYDHLVERYVRPTVVLDQQSEPVYKIQSSVGGPIRVPFVRWRLLKQRFPNATSDPDQGYGFTLTDEQVQATNNPFESKVKEDEG